MHLGLITNPLGQSAATRAEQWAPDPVQPQSSTGKVLGSSEVACAVRSHGTFSCPRATWQPHPHDGLGTLLVLHTHTSPPFSHLEIPVVVCVRERETGAGLGGEQVGELPAEKINTLLSGAELGSGHRFCKIPTSWWKHCAPGLNGSGGQAQFCNDTYSKAK